MKYLTAFASVTVAGVLAGGAAMAAENISGSVPFSPSALGAVPFQSIPNPGVQPIAGEPAYTGRPIAPGATAGSMDLGRGPEVTTPQAAESSGSM
jgi:hypothetical protein